MPDRKSHLVRLTIPSRAGYEKVAMDTAASLARQAGLAAERVEDLRTAVGEACMNAIEHGHGGDARRRVLLAMAATPSEIEIRVRDRGEAFALPQADPSIAAAVESGGSTRGWGIFLIRNLVDEVEFRPLPRVGNLVRMVIELENEE
jgi:serine/threonine-protein kinase RsbW